MEEKNRNGFFSAPDLVEKDLEGEIKKYFSMAELDGNPISTERNVYAITVDTLCTDVAASKRAASAIVTGEGVVKIRGIKTRTTIRPQVSPDANTSN